MRRLVWPAAALAALGLLVALALTGGRGGPGLVPFTAKGLMTIPLEDVGEIDVETGSRRLRLLRTSEGWRVGDVPASTALATQLDTALTLLRNAGPERVLSETEVKETDAAQFGLDPPRMRVTVRARNAAGFAVAFGGKNVLGLSHFARVDGSSEIALLPGYVADAWENVGRTP